MGELDARTPDRQDSHQRVLAEAERDAPEPLRKLVDGVIGILARSGPLIPVMVTSADEEVRRRLPRPWPRRGVRAPPRIGQARTNAGLLAAQASASATGRADRNRCARPPVGASNLP